MTSLETIDSICTTDMAPDLLPDLLHRVRNERVRIVIVGAWGSNVRAVLSLVDLEGARIPPMPITINHARNNWTNVISGVNYDGARVVFKSVAEPDVFLYNQRSSTDNPFINQWDKHVASFPREVHVTDAQTELRELRIGIASDIEVIKNGLATIITRLTPITGE